MSDPSPTPDPAAEPAPGSGDPARRQLDRIPGERYRAGATRPGAGAASTGAAAPATNGSARRGVLAGLLAVAVGAPGYAILGQLDLQLGFLVVAAFGGWVVGIAIVWGSGATRLRRQPVVAAVLAAGAIVVGLLLAWAWSLTEGGVLGPVDYTAQRYGLVAWAGIPLAAALAAIRAR